MIIKVLNPYMNLQWFIENRPQFVPLARTTLKDAVSLKNLVD
jgi:hypothetical protein